MLKKFIFSAFFVLSLQNSQAFGFVHGPSPSIASQPNYAQKVWIIEHDTTEVVSSAFKAFHIGHGRAWSVVTNVPSPNTVRILGETEVLPNELIVFVESQKQNSKIGRSLVSKKDSNGVFKQIKIVSFEGYNQLQKNHFNFVYPISISKSSIHKMRFSNNKPNLNFLLPPNFSPLKVDLPSLVQNVKDLSGVNPISVENQDSTIEERGSSRGRSLTQKYLIQYFQKLGLSAKTICYSSLFRKGCNVEATKLGLEQNKFVVVGAHLDSVNNAGADDNASGTSAVMEAARLIAGVNTRYSVKFVLFDQEELGLVGSGEYVKNLDPQTIVGAVAMDMIGYNSKRDNAFHIIDCGRQDSLGISQLATEINTLMKLGLKRVDACTDRSDHASFWDYNMPAVILSENFFGGDSNKCYHQKCDKIELFNLAYFEKTASLVINTAYALSLGNE